jgi:pilus assembly protein HofN
MYQVNLLPWRMRAQRQRYDFWLRLFGMQLLVVLAIPITALLLLHGQQQQLENTVQGLTQRQQTLTERIQQTQQMMTKLARLTAEETRRQQNERHNRRYLDFLQQLAAIVPDELWLTALDENANGLSLRGISGHYPAIALFEQRLAALPVLQDHHLAEVVQHQSGGLAFTLTARWRTDG